MRLRENPLENKLTVTTDEAIPSPVGKGEVSPRTVGGLGCCVEAWGLIGPTHRMRFEAKLTSKFVRCMSLVLFLEAAEASSGLI